MNRKPDFGSDAAQQVWQAGLDALARAQEHGSKVFDALVQEGQAMQRRAQNMAEAAEARLQELGERVGSNPLSEKLGEKFGDQFGQQWNKLEHLFEERVARALHNLGLPSVQEVQALQKRVAALEAQLAGRAPARKSPPKSAVKKASAKKPAAKQAPAKKTAARKKPVGRRK